MIHTQLCGQEPDIAKHAAGNGYLVIYFRLAVAEQPVSPDQNKRRCGSELKAVTGDLANPLPGLRGTLPFPPSVSTLGKWSRLIKPTPALQTTWQGLASAKTPEIKQRCSHSLDRVSSEDAEVDSLPPALFNLRLLGKWQSNKIMRPARLRGSAQSLSHLIKKSSF